MDDVYYFSSPRKSATVAKHRMSPRSKHKPRTTRKRYPERTNEMLTHRTCMARIEEQLFCPSNASTMFAPGFLTYDTPLDDPTVAPAALTNEFDDDADYDDQEAGGVPIAPSDDCNEDMIMDNTASERSLPIGRTQPDAGAALNNGSSMLRTYHSRPDSREMSEEEDGRRTRLALDGDGSEEEPQFEASLPMSNYIHVNSGNSSRPSTRAGSLSSSAPSLHFPSRRPSRDVLSLQNATSISYIPSASEIESARQLMQSRSVQDMLLDDESLPVDDQQRTYDVADFMDTWRLRALRDKSLPSFESAPHCSLRQRRVPEQVSRRDVIAGDVDMQGIRWQPMGSSRENAARARALLHPSGPAAPQIRSGSSSAGSIDERHYQFRSFVPHHRAKFNHYQLRNALAASSRNDIFYSMGSKVMRSSLACPMLSEVVMDLPKPCQRAGGFRVTCLSASSRSSISPHQTDTVLFAGGFNGEYAVRNLSSNDKSHTEGEVTSCYNGLVTHIHNYADRRSGGLKAAFCSNDRKLRLMDVRNLTFTDVFSYEYPINCSATSADGRLRALVGDSLETLITDAERGKTLVTLREHTDHGFACSWSHDGRNVATGAQDGRVVVWDTRNWSTPVTTLGSTMSCARSLNFTDNGELVVAENDDVVKVYNGGTFASCQEIRFFGSIAGVALMDGGDEIAIANADNTVGGLLSLQRSPQGSRNGVLIPHGASRSRRRQGTEETDLTSDVVV